MADEETPAESPNEPTIAERWLAEQQAWQKTMTTYLDSMVKNDEFLVHLGNAMRGSLLAGKPYPTAPAPGESEPLNETDDRIDEILYAMHQIQGELRDLRAAVEALAQSGAPTPAEAVPVRTDSAPEPSQDRPVSGSPAAAAPPTSAQQTATGAEGGDSV